MNQHLNFHVQPEQLEAWTKDFSSPVATELGAEKQTLQEQVGQSGLFWYFIFHTFQKSEHWCGSAAVREGTLDRLTGSVLDFWPKLLHGIAQWVNKEGKADSPSPALMTQQVFSLLIHNMEISLQLQPKAALHKNHGVKGYTLGNASTVITCEVSAQPPLEYVWSLIPFSILFFPETLTQWSGGDKTPWTQNFSQSPFPSTLQSVWSPGAGQSFLHCSFHSPSSAKDAQHPPELPHCSVC